MLNNKYKKIIEYIKKKFEVKFQNLKKKITKNRLFYILRQKIITNINKIKNFYNKNQKIILIILFFIVLIIHIKFTIIVYKDSLAHIAVQEINENNLKVESIKDTIILDGKIYFNSYEAYANFRQNGGDISSIRPEFNLKNKKMAYYEEYLLLFGYISNVEDRNSIEFCANKSDYKTISEVSNEVLKLKKNPADSNFYNYAIILAFGAIAGIVLIFLYCYVGETHYIMNVKNNFPNIQEITENTSNNRVYIPNNYLAAFYAENNRPSSALEEYYGRMRFDVYLDRSKFQCFIENFKPKGLAEKFIIRPHTSIFNLMATRPDDLVPIRVLDDLKDNIKIPLHFNILNNIYYIDKNDLKKPGSEIPLNSIVKNIGFYQSVLYYKIQPFFYHYRSFLEYMSNIPYGIHGHPRNVGPTLQDPDLMARLYRNKK